MNLILIRCFCFAYSEYMAYRSMINSAVVPPVLTISLSSILSSIAVGCCAFLELEQTYLNDGEFYDNS